MKVRQGGKIIDVDPFATQVQDGPVTVETDIPLPPADKVDHIGALLGHPLTVPTGSVSDVVDWVGDDEDRRRAALAAELAADSPRKTLIAALS